jgi:GT2 family glycosyltransferase
MDTLTVIVPSKTLSNLIPCLRAVGLQNPGTSRIVVDDGIGLPPEASGKLDGLYEQVLPGVKPFIFARNINIGIRAAAGDVILLNDDALLRTPCGFSALQRIAAERPEYGVIAATCNIVGNRRQWPQNKGLREEPRMVCFVCVLIPRRTIDIVGLLDERFTGYGCDDDDYCLRVRTAGLKIGIFDGCFVDHSTLRSTFRGRVLSAGDYRPNLKIFAAKWGASEGALVGKF